jgi:hypothetical protein
VGVVRSLQVRTAEVRDLAAGGEIGAPGIPFERREGSRIGCEGEIRRTHPREGPAVQQLRIDQAEQKTPIVALVKIGVIHLQRSVASREIERDGLVVPEDSSLAKFEVSDGEREELFDRSLSGKCARPFRKVAGAIGIKNDVDDGMIEDQFMKGEFGRRREVIFKRAMTLSA